MQPLNPFLQAFFRSGLPAQCSPASHHILLVPTTQFLLSHRDSETSAAYSDLSNSEDFLASHVLRISGSATTVLHGQDGSSLRDSKGKARQYLTANGHSVVVKDVFVYSNKGFKTLSQAQLIFDTIYYQDTLDAQQWLVYYISRPLIGTPEPLEGLGKLLQKNPLPNAKPGPSSGLVRTTPLSGLKEFKNLADLINASPIVARVVQPGLQQLLSDFGTSFEAQAQSPGLQDDVEGDPLELSLSQETLKRSMEALVSSAIDLFQGVERSHLSFLSEHIGLSSLQLERMAERHVAEQVHDLVFPRLCTSRKVEDADLDHNLKQMTYIDLSQVGMDVPGGQQSRRELAARLEVAIAVFKKMDVSNSPQEMMEIVLETERCLAATPTWTEGLKASDTNTADAEKAASVLTMNADTLVSQLLLVLIRSPVRFLLTRLLYMQRFNFIDDVESGEAGYALSTFEAVVSYLLHESSSLKRSSRANHILWQAVKNGNLKMVRETLKLDSAHDEDESQSHEETALVDRDDDEPDLLVNGSAGYSSEPSVYDTSQSDGVSRTLSFRTPSIGEHNVEPLRAKKRVSIGAGSMSSSSGRSFMSRSSMEGSHELCIPSDTSAEQLAHTTNAQSHSILRMAVESSQVNVLSCLLDARELFPIDSILDDRTLDGTTLLSAALQIGDSAIIDAFLNFIYENAGYDKFSEYLKFHDNKGRSAAHWLFNAPDLIPTIGHLVPWLLQDQQGQTPLFALCRSYDHEKYQWMVENALSIARKCQTDGQPLHLDDHVDKKGNTLLHIVNDPRIIQQLLFFCDSNPNATNERRFTPLMVASKFARLDCVRILFGDVRVDLQARDIRGLTAVELAKDDEVRNRIDDLTLLSGQVSLRGRLTSVVRSFLVEDGSIRLVLKSGAPNANSNTITVTTSRRSAADFENLARGLAIEHPASWIPSVYAFRTPFQLPSKPSRALLRDTQIRLDNFMKVMLAHPTFGTHEMIWEFFLVPDISQATLAERSRRKADLRVDKLEDEYDPIEDSSEVEVFVGHAREQVRSVHYATKVVFRRLNAVRNKFADVSDAHAILAHQLPLLSFVPKSHLGAFSRLAATLTTTEYSPLTHMHYTVLSSISCTTALLHALNRPTTIITTMASAQRALSRQLATSTRTNLWPSALGLLDDTRARLQNESQERIVKGQEELRHLGCELQYTRETVAGDLAGWQDGHAKDLTEGLRTWARRTVVVEQERLAGMNRALRELKKTKNQT